MSQFDSNQNEPSKMKKLLNGGSDDSPLSRLPKSKGATSPKEPAPSSKANVQKTPLSSLKSRTEATPKQTATQKKSYSQNRFLPTFWTIASVISMLVNIGVVIALIVVVRLLGGTQAALDFAQSQADGLLGGLHQNFVKMDEASIKTQIPVSANIPLNITVPVKATTQITLAEAAVIRNAQVIINTGSLDINANATVTLPANTPLTVNLDFPLQVTDTIPVNLVVDVNIPLKDTELHEPFVGLQKVVEPYYCMLQPNTLVNGVNVCANTTPIFPITP
ncbi:MAG TPA: hypothetical protein VLA72_20900 [Anaerolineales bacterium]|nr:hypothetical protein [Anaerolineales bacterium]